MKYPKALAETIALFADFNSLGSKGSRRSVVSFFLHYSTSMVPALPLPSKLCIDEDTSLAVIRQVVRNGELKVVRYHGTVDFVLGHSEVLSKMPQDAAVLLTMTRKGVSFDESFPQASAQAAALFGFRRLQMEQRGVIGSGGPIYFIRTDGQRWIFSKLTCDEGRLKIQQSDEVELKIRNNKEVDGETIQVIFDWLRFVIKAGRKQY